MARGRKPKADPPVGVYFNLPRSLNAQFELLLYDPLTQKPRYGGRSAVLTQLIREWIESQRRLLQQGQESANLPLSSLESPNGNRSPDQTDPSVG